MILLCLFYAEKTKITNTLQNIEKMKYFDSDTSKIFYVTIFGLISLMVYVFLSLLEEIKRVERLKLELEIKGQIFENADLLEAKNILQRTDEGISPNFFWRN